MDQERNQKKFKVILTIFLCILTLLWFIKELTATSGKILTIKVALDNDNNSSIHLNVSNNYDQEINVSNVKSYINERTKSFLISLVKNATKDCISKI